MSIIVCKDKCKVCGLNLVKNPECSGDYHDTVQGFVLMRYCTSCGRMLPLIEEQEEVFVSGNMKRRVAVRCATAYSRGYCELKEIVKDLKKITDLACFVNLFARRSGLSPSQVLACY